MPRSKTILTAAVTGNLTQRSQNPNLPITPEEIARAALGAAAEGATIVHLHVRDPRSGTGSMRLDLYEELVGRIRDENRDVLINLTTGEGGRFVPTPGDPQRAAPGSTLCAPELRVAHVEALRPDICTLDLNTMWSGRASVINAPDNVRIMARRIYASGVTPEIEIFDSGDLHLMHHLIDSGDLRLPLMIQLVLGVRFGAMATPQTMAYLVSMLPDDVVWAAFGVGRAAFPMLAQSVLLGGHVRIGMEDTVHIAKGELCRDNAQLVAKAVALVRDLGGDIASPEDARAILKLRDPAGARLPA
ncbi:3-keto-5-aminohexanoate cleavage protein [Rhodobacteraceae bacterium CCMM004]|nr:3-keto-5-aminohexanoate cleavage protein [Rhodobacteraceae bacterium CCMM004]